MSGLGQKQTSRLLRAMSALPSKADIGTQPCDVCFVPKADILHCGSQALQSPAIGSSLTRQKPTDAGYLMGGWRVVRIVSGLTPRGTQGSRLLLRLIAPT